MKFNELRDKYPEFIYHGFQLEENEDEIVVIYDFEIVDLERFNPSYSFPKKRPVVFSDKKVVLDLVFSLGLVECMSYWKCTCSPRITIKCGQLSDKQKQWWKKLYFHGLGEFFYVNKINPDFDDFMTLVCEADTICGEPLQQDYKGQLIPVGGGKDSFVSLKILKTLFDDNDTFVINPVMSAIHASEAAGYKDKLIYVTRTLDKRMIELNKKGFLNGHTPFSAMVAFASTLAAVLNQKKYICLSNEASANEATVLNGTVNHQYSKSYEFERDFYEYSQNYICKDVHYFSLLRPLSELQIAKIFATCTAYHAVFKSCNVGSKQEIWCCNCAKCLFVYILLAAYLNDEECSAIFGCNMLNKEELLDTFMELCGLSDNKPFECVGTREEVQTAIALGIQQRKLLDRPLGILYEKYIETGVNISVVVLSSIRNEWNGEHHIPDYLLELVKREVEESFDAM